MELGDFRLVQGRNNRRKQAKTGRFDKEKKLTYKSSKTNSEYGFPNLTKSELESLKREIRDKIKMKNRKNLILFSTLLFVSILVFLFFYFTQRI